MDNEAYSPSTIVTNNQPYSYYSVPEVCEDISVEAGKLPYCLRVILEAAIRKCDGVRITRQEVRDIATWKPNAKERTVLGFFPSRVILQDFTGIPVLVDLAAMRAELERRGDDPEKINPIIPVDLVVDHSIQMDFTGIPDALVANVKKEYERNMERYRFLRWAQQAFKNLRIVPPSNGIIHQVNLEFLSPVVQRTEDPIPVIYPDSVLGTDSHTPMINGLGVLGWGVGGIEAISAMLNQPVELMMPDIIGIRLSGKLLPGVTPTDLTLHLTQLLRKAGVVNKFLEYFGSGLDDLTLADRAMIANMTPENGATVSYFPVDQQTLDYLQLTGRTKDQINLVEEYYKKQGMFRTSNNPEPDYTSVIEFDLGTVEPSVAGPKRPQDRVRLRDIKQNFVESLEKPKNERGFEVEKADLRKVVEIKINSNEDQLRHGAVVLAAITSCTNTSNPEVMVTAGLLAKKAIELGLRVPSYVKTSLAPGSKVVADYLSASGLQGPLDQLGFHVAGFGCATCIGNSGPLKEEIASAIKGSGIVAAAVLSGNRNFEGRISSLTQANYLASPPLVVAFALAGKVDINFDSEPVGISATGTPVYLKDLWPDRQTVNEVIKTYVRPEIFARVYKQVFSGDTIWNAMKGLSGTCYPWDATSTYIQEPPYFTVARKNDLQSLKIENARILAILADSVTTDHISPAGSISSDSPAGRYLQEKGISPADFNSYGSRRGNDQVMARGTFANIRLRNQMAYEKEGGFTTFQPDGEMMTIFDASQEYAKNSVPLVVIAGKEYGTGSSRDWAAKGPMLLGVKVVIAESFERIHRSNLAGIGILPLQFSPGETAETLGIIGDELLTIEPEQGKFSPGCLVRVSVVNSDGSTFNFITKSRLDTSLEVNYFQYGGLLNEVINAVV